MKNRFFKVILLLVSIVGLYWLYVYNLNNTGALLGAFVSCDMQLAKAYLAIGADPDAPELENGWTSLHHTSAAGNSEAVSLLVAHGAKVNVKNHSGETPLHLAKDARTARLLINSGANVNARDRSGNTPLHLAIRRYRLDVVKLLLSSNADINARDCFNRTPLELALEEHKKEVWHKGRTLTDLTNCIIMRQKSKR